VTARRGKTAKRPRIWVPGVLYVSDELEICVGSEVGFNGWGKAFSVSACGHFASAADLHHSAWIVERSALDDALIDEHAIIVPERLLDPQGQPHARRWLAEQPLLCVSGAKLGRLVDAGLRVYVVAIGVHGEGSVRLEAHGGKRASWQLSGQQQQFWPPEPRDRGEVVDGLPVSEEPAVRLALDRVMRAVSRGVLTELAVINALAARRLAEPGYGYQGASDGVAAPIEQVQRRLRGLEELFRQIDQRAEAMRDDALAIVEALEQVGDDDEHVAIPAYDRARRIRLPELTIKLTDVDDEGPSWLLGEEPQKTLVLPDHSRWVVDRVDLFTPTLPEDLHRELEEEQRRSGARPPYAAAIAMLVLLLAIIVAALWQLR
jgi:hypothetical protein